MDMPKDIYILRECNIIYVLSIYHPILYFSYRASVDRVNEVLDLEIGLVECTSKRWI